MAVTEEVCQPEILDTGRVLDQSENEWVSGYQNFYKQQFVKTFIDSITFDDTLSTKTSGKFLSAPYRKFTLLLDLDVTASPTDIVIEIQLSDGSSKFYKLMDGVFTDLRYEDTAGDKKEAIQGVVNAPYFRIKATATGTTAANKFTLTAKVIFSS